MSDWLVKKGTQLNGRRREEPARRLRVDYEAGATIRSLSEESGRSYGSVRRLLLESGAALRKRGSESHQVTPGRPGQQPHQPGPPPILSRTRL